MDSDKQQAVWRLEILRLVFELMYDTFEDLRHDRHGGFNRMQAVSRKLAASLSRCEFSSDRCGAMADVERCVELLREECGCLLAEGACSARQRREAEMLVSQIVQLAARMREREYV